MQKPTTLPPLHLTLLQMNLAWQEPEKNRRQVREILNSHRGETDLILLPEMFTTGFTMEVSQNYEEIEGPTVSWMQDLARERGAWIGGSLIIKEKGSYYNRFLLVSQEGIMAEYDKRHLFRMAQEHDYFMEGEEFVRARLKGWKIAPMVCYDLRFPVWSRNRLDEDRSLAVDLLLYVANWPAKRIEHWNILLKARAIENQCFVAGLNRVGVDGNEIAYNGSSAIIDPLGQVLVHQRDEACILEQQLDPETMISFRNKFPAWMDSDLFEISI